ncbi:transglutaminase family protein [Undibacter mobilis]|uniref:Transglutaminase family protein n=1 Tax=Undibacter mobilis TaxID=2292256 RepID=A0A371BCH2_9BRAD|nr:transglutaminase family protein [Undibacter mobilis]RDV05315.1 transglutaminase family protein [Undibacter mobilis]
MRIRIAHTTSYHYDAPPKSVTQVLRLTPRNHDGQYVVNWRIDLSRDCQLHQREGAFGNISHVFTADGPFDELTVMVEGEIDTQDTSGVIRGTVERFPPALYLRDTQLTEADAAIIAFAEETRAEAGGDTLTLLHALMAGLNDTFSFDTEPTHAGTTAAEAFKLKRGVCQDGTHIFIAAARHLGIPARYIGGHYCRTDEAAPQDAGHAWAEAYIDKLGWVGFDPTHGLSPTEAHVRVAVGLDYLGAAPVRGSRIGGGKETMTVTVRVSPAPWQPQSSWQSQSQQ